ncbi:uncharacterized protein LOC133248682 [Bos javanicus]|uniref:uncharacterized protein LOC133248682 n=1 Tax=Bos javanicus TaxID=9906 RepID=UPI002AA908C1|nr:uncharacterized protein LOC133248682 [Bos javanicus]
MQIDNYRIGECKERATQDSKRWRGPGGSRKPGLATSQTEAFRVPPPPQDSPDSVTTTLRKLHPLGAEAEEASQLHSSFHHTQPSVPQGLAAPETQNVKCQRPGQLLGRRQRRLKRARGPWPPPLSPSLLPQEAARRRLLRAGGSPGERSLGEAPAPAEGTGPRIQNCRCSYPTTATLYVPSTTLPIHTPSLPPPPPPPLPRPLRSPSLDWSRDKSNGKRRAGTLPADPGRDRPGPEAFPRLARAPNPPLPPRAPLPDFRNFAKNSPHEFSCPADPRWRRIHRGGCWEQDLYPLTPAVTPAVPTSLQAAAAEEGSGDCGPDRVGGPSFAPPPPPSSASYRPSLPLLPETHLIAVQFSSFRPQNLRCLCTHFRDQQHVTITF